MGNRKDIKFEGKTYSEDVKKEIMVENPDVRKLIYETYKAVDEEAIMAHMGKKEYDLIAIDRKEFVRMLLTCKYVADMILAEFNRRVLTGEISEAQTHYFSGLDHGQSIGSFVMDIVANNSYLAKKDGVISEYDTESETNSEAKSGVDTEDFEDSFEDDIWGEEGW